MGRKDAGTKHPRAEKYGSPLEDGCEALASEQDARLLCTSKTLGACSYMELKTKRIVRIQQQGCCFPLRSDGPWKGVGFFRRVASRPHGGCFFDTPALLRCCRTPSTAIAISISSRWCSQDVEKQACVPPVGVFSFGSLQRPHLPVSGKPG